MGAKIITEKDFWMCSSGAMPAQLQGTRKSNKKESGDAYITVADTSTSSWIDFGCTKNMLLAAILTAVAVIVVVALIVGTGGVALIGIAGMMAIGAAAGVTAGVVMAVKGAMTCGQKNATQRTWSGSKSNLMLTNMAGITGDRTMTCKIGGTVVFAPEIKSWIHAITLGGLNYLTKLAECAAGGAAVGAGGFLVSGLAGGSIAMAVPTVSSVVGNLTGGFTGIWGASRALFAADKLANDQAMGQVHSGADAFSSLVNGGVPEVGSLKRIFTGQAQPQDAMILLYFLNVKGIVPKEPAVEEPALEETTTNEEGTTPAIEGQGEGNNNGSGAGQHDAFESPTPVRTEPIIADPPFNRNPNHDLAEFQSQIEGQQNGMNNLTVEDFINNRDAYLENGRSSEGSAAQERFREQYREDMIDRLMEEDGLSYDDAEARTNDFMSDKAALHDPDQIAGGHGDNVTGLGNGRVNSSLGSQWKTRIDAIDAQVREQSANMTPEQRANTYLNITLPWQ